MRGRVYTVADKDGPVRVADVCYPVLQDSSNGQDSLNPADVDLPPRKLQCDQCGTRTHTGRDDTERFCPDCETFRSMEKIALSNGMAS